MAISPERAVPRLFQVSLLEFDDAALQADHGGVSAVVGAQFGEDILDSAFDGLFGNRELIGNLFVGIPGGDQTQDRDFRRSQGVIDGVLGELERDLRGTSSFSRNGLHGSYPAVPYVG